MPMHLSAWFLPFATLHADMTWLMSQWSTLLQDKTQWKALTREAGASYQHLLCYNAIYWMLQPDKALTARVLISRVSSPIYFAPCLHSDKQACILKKCGHHCSHYSAVRTIPRASSSQHGLFTVRALGFIVPSPPHLSAPSTMHLHHAKPAPPLRWTGLPTL